MYYLSPPHCFCRIHCPLLQTEQNPVVQNKKLEMHFRGKPSNADTLNAYLAPKLAILGVSVSSKRYLTHLFNCWHCARNTPPFLTIFLSSRTAFFWCFFNKFEKIAFFWCIVFYNFFISFSEHPKVDLVWRCWILHPNAIKVEQLTPKMEGHSFFGMKCQIFFWVFALLSQ